MPSAARVSVVVMFECMHVFLVERLRGHGWWGWGGWVVGWVCGGVFVQVSKSGQEGVVGRCVGRRISNDKQVTNRQIRSVAYS